jgi:hypothetical protein
MDEIQQHLQTLGLKPGATPDQAKQAYCDLMMVWHPDRFPPNSRLQQLAQEKAKEINIAYDKVKTDRGRIEPRIDPARRSPANTPQPSRQRPTSAASSNPGPQQERSRQSGKPNTTTAQAGRSTAKRASISASVGFLLMFFGGVSGALLLSFDYAGVAVWKVLLIESLMGISLFSLAKATRDHPQLTLWTYLKVFAITTFWISVRIVLVAAWLLDESRGRTASTKAATQ